MTTYATSFEGGTAGTQVGNTGTGGDDFVPGNTGTGATFNYDSLAAACASGSLCAKVTTPATATSCYRAWSLTTATPNVRIYVYLTAYPSAALDVIQLVTLNATTNRVRLRINTTGTISVLNNSTASATTTGVIPLNTLVRIEADWLMSLTAGTVKAEIYNGHSTTPITNGTISQTGQAFTSATIDQFRIGVPINTSNITFYTDAWAVSDTGRLGPVTAVTTSGWKIVTAPGTYAPATLRVVTSGGSSSLKTLAQMATAGDPVFMTRAQIAQLSTTSAAALRMKGIADQVKNGTLVGGSTTDSNTNIKDVDNRISGIAIGTALWWAKTQDSTYLAPLKTFILNTPRPPSAVQALNEFRGISGLFLAVDILKKYGQWDDNAVCPNHNNDTWLTVITGYDTRVINTAGGRWTRLTAPGGVASNEGTADDSASNWGGVAIAARTALDIIQGDQAGFDINVLRMRKWLGDTDTGLADFTTSGTFIGSWYNRQTVASATGQLLPSGIGDRDAANPGLDATIVDDINRGGTGYSATTAFYGATGSGLTYPFENFDGRSQALACMINMGYPVRTWGDNGLVRICDRFALQRIAGESLLINAEADNQVYYPVRALLNRMAQKSYGTVKASTSNVAGLSRAMPYMDWLTEAAGWAA